MALCPPGQGSSTLLDNMPHKCPLWSLGGQYTSAEWESEKKQRVSELPVCSYDSLFWFNKVSLLPIKRYRDGENDRARGSHSSWIIIACRTSRWVARSALCVALPHCDEAERSDLWLCHNRPHEGCWRPATMLMEPPVSRCQGMQKSPQ